MDLAVFKAFGEALAIGFLIGVERLKDRDPGEKKSAGTRTFMVFALLGAVCGLLRMPWATGVTFAALTGFLALGYHRQSRDHLGLTTEVSGLLTFWLGYLVYSYESLAISVGIVTVILLASKRAMHRFVREQLTETEFYDTLKFLVVVFVVLPLLPNRDIGPYQFFNPMKVWMLIVLVSTISYSGYVLVRILGSRRGLTVSALVGGLVSTTAETMSLAERTREMPERARDFGVMGVMANAMQFPRLLLLVWVVDTGLARFMAVPLLGMCAVGLAGAWVLARARKPAVEEGAVDLPIRNPYSFLPALKFGLFFVGIFFFSRVATVWWGDGGIYVASAVAGLGDAGVISLSAAGLVSQGTLSIPAAAGAILVAVAMNDLMKWVLARVNGNSDLAFWMGGGFVTMLTTGVCLAAVMYSF